MMKPTRICNYVAVVELYIARAATDVDNANEHSTNAMGKLCRLGWLWRRWSA
jgi:hypothetical protein